MASEAPEMTPPIAPADIICIRRGWGVGSDGPNYHPDEGAMSRLDVTAVQEEELASKVEESLEELQDMFTSGLEVPVGR